MAGRLNFSLTQLEYVLAVNKHGHFLKAAEACHVTQPTLSMQLHKLENDLGVVIFDRSKKPIILTDGGKKLIEQIQTIVFEARELNQIIRVDQERGLDGHLVMGVIPTIAPFLLPRLLPQVEKMYPDLHLRVQELQTHQIIESLGEDKIDLGVLAIPLLAPGVQEQSLYFEPFSILCRKGHELGMHKKVKSSALKGKDLWLLEEGHCLRHQVLDVCSLRKQNNSQRQFTFESGSLETLKNLIDAYGGYTLLPHLATEAIGAQSQIVPFEKPIPAREIGLVFRRVHYKRELIQAIKKAILECIPQTLKKTRRKDLEVVPVE